jgi:hypothetical protein
MRIRNCPGVGYRRVISFSYRRLIVDYRLDMIMRLVVGEEPVPASRCRVLGEIRIPRIKVGRDSRAKSACTMFGSFLPYLEMPTA